LMSLYDSYVHSLETRLVCFELFSFASLDFIDFYQG